MPKRVSDAFQWEISIFSALFPTIFSVVFSEFGGVSIEFALAFGSRYSAYQMKKNRFLKRLTINIIGINNVRDVISASMMVMCVAI